MTNELRRPDVLPNESYVDIHKMEKLTELVHELIEKINVKPFGVDVGKVNNEPFRGWYSVIVLPFEREDVFYVRYPELHEAAQDVINYAKTMKGLDRLAINILEPGCLLPLHYDNWTNADDMGDPPHYNILVPLNGNGHSIVNDKLYVNKKDEPLIFDPQSYHGGFNSTYEDRYNYFIKIKNEAFNNVST
jgi:hypothetical protein